jgi:hypothetical protein
VAIEEFVRAGGTLIVLERSGAWAKELFDLPLADVTRPEPKEEEGSAGQEPKFSCPGSVLRAVPAEHPLTAGLPPSVALFFSGSSAWAEVDAEGDGKEGGDSEESGSTVEVLLRYAPARVLLSGWIRQPETIADEGAWVRVRHGEGRIHLFAFRPQYRGWSEASFPLLLRAALLDRATR